MLFTTQTVSNEEIKSLDNFFNEFENADNKTSEEVVETPISKYITSLVSSCYQKSVNDIANTKIGNKIVRKRNLQQVMQESFFYGANRFGKNFIA